jgi:C1A family cysteine protease
VYNSNNCNFWEGTRLEGGHGISLTGWRDDDFIIQNSWGEDWCKQGATLLPSNRFNLLIEMWTIIA